LKLETEGQVSRGAAQSTNWGVESCRRAILAPALLLVFLAGVADGRPTSEADRAEAKYLKKILSFVEWSSAPGNPGESFRVCVAPDYRLTFPISEELRDLKVNGRTVAVRMVGKQDSLKNCQLLFIGSPEPKMRAKFLDSVKGTQILTVGDDAGFLEAGGILEFAVVGNTIQFAVNLPAAKRAGLKIDSRLLALAQRVLQEKQAAGT
jgi:hypothetical protein